jgi:hypothetical protein
MFAGRKIIVFSVQGQQIEAEQYCTYYTFLGSQGKGNHCLQAEQLPHLTVLALTPQGDATLIHRVAKARAVTVGRQNNG